MSESKPKRPIPVIFGCAGTRLDAQERSLFRGANPFGFILFKRNCESREQIRLLIAELKQAVGREDLPIAIDQEGGRVSRLDWLKYPAAGVFGMMYARDSEWGIEAIKIYSRIVAHELAAINVTINCAPVIDLFTPESSAAIGDRAFSASPAAVSALARAQVETYLTNGILPVVKHMPGHGKLKTDPHEVLPIIDASRVELESHDFIPFEFLKDAPLGMNSHAIFKALDPERPASLSPMVNNDIIRKVIGFEGLLLSDDLTMKALSGLPRDRALRALGAGNDVILHCNGEIEEMESIARNVDRMSEKSWARWEKAKTLVKPLDSTYAPREDIDRLNILLGGLAFDEMR